MSSAPAPRPRVRVWPLRVRSTAMLVGACVAIGAAGALVLHGAGDRRAHALQFGSVSAGGLRADAVWEAGEKAAPPIALRDQSNRLVSLSGQRGRPVLLAFMDSHCKLICTVEGPTIHRALSRVRATVPVTLLVVSVNPWEDTAASSRAAAGRWGFAGDWHWLRGSPAQLRPLWRAYGMEVARTAGDVNHSTAVYLIDGRGYERAGFNYPFPADQVAHDLWALARPQTS